MRGETRVSGVLAKFVSFDPHRTRERRRIPLSVELNHLDAGLRIVRKAEEQKAVDHAIDADTPPGSIPGHRGSAPRPWLGTAPLRPRPPDY